MDPRVVTMLHRAVAQGVLIYGLDTWILLAVMERKVVGTNAGFMRKITGKRAHWKADIRWVTPRT